MNSGDEQQRVRRAIDDQIAHVEHTVEIAISEVLWGGPRGKGIVHTVSDLAATVQSLAGTVTELSKCVNGDDGVKQQIGVLDDRVARMEKMLLWVARASWGLVAAVTVPGLVWFLSRIVTISVKGST